MSLNANQLAAIAKQIYQKFPELKGTEPEVQNRNGVGAKSLGETHLIIFKEKPAVTKSITRIVRVTADAHGAVIKISTSR